MISSFELGVKLIVLFLSGFFVNVMLEGRGCVRIVRVCTRGSFFIFNYFICFG